MSIIVTQILRHDHTEHHNFWLVYQHNTVGVSQVRSDSGLQEQIPPYLIVVAYPVYPDAYHEEYHDNDEVVIAYFVEHISGIRLLYWIFFYFRTVYCSAVFFSQQATVAHMSLVLLSFSGHMTEAMSPGHSMREILFPKTIMP